jgi:hypothetical protein
MILFFTFPKLPVAQAELCLKKKFFPTVAEIFLFPKKIYSDYGIYFNGEQKVRQVFPTAAHWAR